MRSNSESSSSQAWSTSKDFTDRLFPLSLASRSLTLGAPRAARAPHWPLVHRSSASPAAYERRGSAAPPAVRSSSACDRPLPESPQRRQREQAADQRENGHESQTANPRNELRRAGPAVRPAA